MQNQVEPQKRDYSHISIKKRMQLVKQVLKRGRPLSEVIKALDIKITTARFIINKYKESGSFPRRKFRKTGSGKKTADIKLEQKEEQMIYQERHVQEEAMAKQEGLNLGQNEVEQQASEPCLFYWYYYPLVMNNQLYF